MRIGVIVPIGPLTRFGYQHLHRLTIPNHCLFADCVYLVSSTRSVEGLDDSWTGCDNLKLISDASTWFDLDPDGNEFFSIHPVERNVNRAAQQAREEGMDCVVQLHVNQYVPEDIAAKLRAYCESACGGATPYAWLYRRFQLGDRLLHTNARLPWIVNLRIENPFRFSSDSLTHVSSDLVVRRETDDFREFNGLAVVDCNLELTVEDLRDVRTFTRFYSEIRPEADRPFDWADVRAYYQRKIDAVDLSQDVLSETGRKIAAIDDPSFVSRVLLQDYRSTNVRSGRRSDSFLRRALRRVARGLRHRWSLLCAKVREHKHWLVLIWRTANRANGYRDYLRQQFVRSYHKRTQNPGTRAQCLVSAVLTSSPIPRRGHVLCVGCRNRYEIDLFRREGFRNVVGIDLFSSHSDVHVMDMHHMEFPDSTFDLIYACHSLEHAHDPVQVLREIVRVAKNGATVAIETPICYQTTGADLHDFGDAEGILAGIRDRVGVVLFSEEAEGKSDRNAEGNRVARVVFRVTKTKRIPDERTCEKGL